MRPKDFNFGRDKAQKHGLISTCICLGTNQISPIVCPRVPIQFFFLLLASDI